MRTTTTGFGDEPDEPTIVQPLQVTPKQVSILEPNPHGNANTVGSREELPEVVGRELGQGQLVGTIQSKYGLAKEEAERQVDEFARKAEPKAGSRAGA